VTAQVRQYDRYSAGNRTCRCSARSRNTEPSPKCHRGLQRGQRRVREPEVADADQVREAEVAAAEPDSALRSAVGTPRDRQVDDGRGPLEHPVPVRRGRPGHRRRLATRPQPGRPHPRLVAQPVPADQEHPREQALPVPVAHPAVHGGRGQAAAARRASVSTPACRAGSWGSDTGSASPAPRSPRGRTAKLPPVISACGPGGTYMGVPDRTCRSCGPRGPAEDGRRESRSTRSASAVPEARTRASGTTTADLPRCGGRATAAGWRWGRAGPRGRRARRGAARRGCRRPAR
jgi:hypothetical protein